MDQLAGQLDLLDILDAEAHAQRHYEDAPTIHGDQELRCPACGYARVWTWRLMEMFHGWGRPGGICQAMSLTWAHVVSVLDQTPAGDHPSQTPPRRTTAKEVRDTVTRFYAIWGEERARAMVPAEHRPADLSEVRAARARHETPEVLE